MNLSIKKRIYLSFYLLASLVAVSSITIIITLNYNQKLSRHLTEVSDPSVQKIYDFRKMLLQSQMFATNWVFIRSSEDDKKALTKLHIRGYPQLKRNLTALSSQWYNTEMRDTLNNMFNRFEILMRNERYMMRSLVTFEDYEDPVKKFAAEEMIESIILPETKSLTNSVNLLLAYELKVKATDEEKLNKAGAFIRTLMLVVSALILAMAVFLSIYMKKIIITPIDRMINIVNDLGKGIIRKVDQQPKNDEIGRMITSVNNLSDNLSSSTRFAYEIGRRNFDAPFKPLSSGDTLGKALITMRDNLKSSDERLNEAQHIAKLGNWELNVVTKKVYWSDAMYEIMDADATMQNTVAHNFIDFVYEKDKQMVQNHINHLYCNKIFIDYECRIITPKNNIKYIHVQANPVLGKEGQLLKVIGIIQDISKRKKIEEELIHSEKHSRNIFNQSTVGLVLARMDGTLADVNETYASIIGYSVEEAKNISYWEITPEKYRDIELEKLEELKDTGHYASYEKEYINKKGQHVPVRMSGLIIDKAGEKYILSSVEDITESKRAQEAILKKNSELQKTNHELDKFVYSVSHDLRAPLLSMLGVAEITEELTEEEHTREHVQMLKSSINRLDKLIGEILEYSRNARDDVRHERIDFEKLVREVTKDILLKTQMAHKVEIQVAINGNGVIWSDQHRISVVLNNLISNAINYQKITEQHPFVKINIKLDNDQSTIDVEDNGIGIEKEQHEKIFEMFYRGSNASVGSGLGLYVVKETVEKLNGDICVESQPGKGTKFKLHLPNLLYQ